MFLLQSPPDKTTTSDLKIRDSSTVWWSSETSGAAAILSSGKPERGGRGLATTGMVIDWQRITRRWERAETSWRGNEPIRGRHGGGVAMSPHRWPHNDNCTWRHVRQVDRQTGHLKGFLKSQVSHSCYMSQLTHCVVIIVEVWTDSRGSWESESSLAHWDTLSLYWFCVGLNLDLNFWS